MNNFNLPLQKMKFYNSQTNETLSNLWSILADGAWKNINVENMANNEVLSELNCKDWKSIIKNIHPIHPWMEWNREDSTLKEIPYIPKLREVNQGDFLKASENFFNSFSGKKIGVHLSGGFDSSLIIGLLRYFNIPFSLIGMCNERFEFRTESHIQNILSDSGINTVLINHENYLPVTNLNNIPVHQYPEVSSLGYMSSTAIAKECNSLGIEVIFSGSGGDYVFTDEVPLDPNECVWKPKMLNSSWHNDIIYNPYGVSMISFYGNIEIIEILYNLRRGQKEDGKKLWARNYFKSFVPNELVKYTYYADFWGLYVDGLQMALPVVRELFDTSYQLTGNSQFSEESYENMFSQDLLNTNKEMYQKIEATISIAAWLNSLKKNGVIKK